MCAHVSTRESIKDFHYQKSGTHGSLYRGMDRHRTTIVTYASLGVKFLCLAMFYLVMSPYLVCHCIIYLELSKCHIKFDDYTHRHAC